MLALTLSLAVISTMDLSGEVPAAGGDYLIVEFQVPEGTVELEISHDDASKRNILDWGIWDPAGFRGWGGGLEDPAVIGEEVSSRGYLPGTITPGTWQLVIGKAKILDDPASYAGTVTFRDAPTLAPRARAAFDPVVIETGARWYRGDFHVHSNESGDASATFDEIATLGRQRGLDFVVLSDHNTVSQHGLQAEFQKTLDDFLLVRGNEVTTYGGHGNAVGSSAYIDHRIGLDGRDARGIIADARAQDAIFIINHPTLDLGDACIGCPWTNADTPWDQVTAIEIQNGPAAVTGALFTPNAIKLWDEQLDAGNRLAPVGGSDDHSAGQDTGVTASPIGSPTTLVYADELSEPALIRAVSEGRTIVQLRGPDDPMVELTATAGSAKPARIGDTITADEITLEARVTGARGYTLNLFRNGAREERVVLDSDDWTMSFPITVKAAGDRFRAQLTDNGSQLVVVTGHIYAQPGGGTPDGGPGPDVTSDGSPDSTPPADALADSAGSDQAGGDTTVVSGGGCSVTGTSPTGSPLLLLLLLASLLLRRRRR